MPLRYRTVVLTVTCLFLFLHPAWALTEQELLTQSQDLQADYDDLESRIDTCTNGTCPEASALADELDALGVRLAQLHVDRNSLSSCGCQQVDTILADLDQLDGTLQVAVGSWDLDETVREAATKLHAAWTSEVGPR